MWFKYQFKEGVTKEKKDEIYTFWDRFDTYFTTIYEQGKTVLMDMSYAKTDDGWEAWQIFVDAEAYETHSETAAKCQLMEQVAELQENWEEVDAWISGPEEELAKAPSLAKDYPNQKRIFKNSEVRYDPLWFGFKNMKDGDEKDKTGGPMVFEFEFEYNNPDDKDECVSIINKLQQEMKSNDVMGPIMTMLKFWHVNEGKGYKCIEICRSAELYDKHCEMLANSAVGAEGMKLGEMLTQTSGRVYGLAGDLNASTMLPMFYPTIERVHGTPIIEAWGESFFGWAN